MDALPEENPPTPRLSQGTAAEAVQSSPRGCRCATASVGMRGCRCASASAGMLRPLNIGRLGFSNGKCSHMLQRCAPIETNNPTMKKWPLFLKQWLHCRVLTVLAYIVPAGVSQVNPSEPPRRVPRRHFLLDRPVNGDMCTPLFNKQSKGSQIETLTQVILHYLHLGRCPPVQLHQK